MCAGGEGAGHGGADTNCGVGVVETPEGPEGVEAH